MKPGGIGPLKPPAPVYRPCALCGRKHRMRPNGSSKTGEILVEETEVLVWVAPDPYIKVPAGTFVCRSSLNDRIRCPAKQEDIEALREQLESLTHRLHRLESGH